MYTQAAHKLFELLRKTLTTLNKEQHVSLERLGALIGRQKSTVGKYISGQRGSVEPPPINEMITMLQNLGVDLDTILREVAPEEASAIIMFSERKNRYFKCGFHKNSRHFNAEMNCDHM